MLEVTENAKTEIEKYFEENESSPIRVYVASGCGGTGLALALDEPKDTDDVFDKDGVTFVVDKALMATASPITVDFGERGFSIDSGMTFEQDAAGGCSACTGCG